MSNIVSGIAQRKIVGSSAKKAVLMLMAACASDDGTGVWASKANMARDLEMSKRTVHAAIQHFIDIGLIVEAGTRPAKNGFTYVYDINIDLLEALPSTRAADAPVQQMHPTRAADAPQDVQELHPNRIGTVKEPKRYTSECEEAVSEFNAASERVGWSKVQKLTAARRSALMARLEDCGGLDGWRYAIAKAEASPFLTGQNKTGWQADFDFLCKAQKFIKLMEGSYDQRDRNTEQDDPALRSIAAAARAF